MSNAAQNALDNSLDCIGHIGHHMLPYMVILGKLNGLGGCDKNHRRAECRKSVASFSRLD